MGHVIARIANTWRELAEAWHRFWFSESDPTTLCVMRILVGGMLVYTVAVWGLMFDAFLGEHAWNSPALLQRLQTPGFAPSFWWYVPESWQMPVHCLCLVVLVMFTVGLWTRATSVLSMIILISYSYRAHMSNYGLDQINAILTFYLCLAPCGARFSVDSWLRRRSEERGGHVEPSSAANLATRLMQVHFCVIYSFAALAKLQGEGWWNGEAIWMAVANTEYQTIDMTWIAWYPWVSDLATHSSMLFELTFWALVWGRFRPVVLFVGAMLHLSIGAMMGMWTFAFIMIFGHLAFWPPELMNRILARMVPFVKRPSTPAIHASMLLAAICTLSLGGCSEKIDSFDEYIQLARLRERQGDYPGAAQAYSQALSILPDDATTFYDRGVAHLSAGETATAIEDYSRAVAIDPEFAIAWNNLGAAQLLNEQHLAGIQSCSRAIDLDPIDVLPWRNRGLTYHALGMFSASIDDLTQADRLEPSDPFTLLSLGISLLDDAQPRRAIEAFTASLEIDDAEPATWLNRAIARYRLGEQAAAEADLNQARSLGENVTGSVQSLSDTRTTPMPKQVKQHLITEGYEQTEQSWSKSDESVRVIAKPLRNGAAHFHEPELAALIADESQKVLVLFEPTGDGIRVKRMFENWVPDQSKFRAMEVVLPVE